MDAPAIGANPWPRLLDDSVGFGFALDRGDELGVEKFYLCRKDQEGVLHCGEGVYRDIEQRLLKALENFPDPSAHGGSSLGSGEPSIAGTPT